MEPVAVSVLAVIVAILSLIVSVVTLWITVLRRGVLKMTRPTVVFLGPDGGNGPPKIFLRALLYTTGIKGHVIDSMYVRLSRGESAQNFNIWVYGDDKLVRGSGLFVGPNGISANHHFLHPKNEIGFLFRPGQYTLQVFAITAGADVAREIRRISLDVSAEQAQCIQDTKSGLYFDWGPDSQRYHPHLDDKPRSDPVSRLLESLLGDKLVEKGRPAGVQGSESSDGQA